MKVKALINFLKKKIIIRMEEIQLPIEPVKIEEPKKPEIKKVIDPVLWFPTCFVPKFRMRTQGRYRKGYPEGAVIHATAGWDRDFSDALNTHNYGAREGLCWITIAPDGRIIQSTPLDQFGSHAGESKWPSVPGERVSRYFVGIEVVCAGTLTAQGAPEFKKEVPFAKDDIRELKVSSPHWGPAGLYKKFSDAQEVSLINLLLWLYKNNPEVFSLDNVMGHHECAGMLMLNRWRKVDPGGCLSMPMDDFRKYLKSQV
jgi:hypothetical protein